MLTHSEEQAGEGGRVVVIPCSGIGKALGSVAREAAYIVVEDLRPGAARTVCLSLLTMGDPDARELVRRLPTLTIDGCAKACAQKNVQASGATPAACYRVLDAYRENRELKVDSVLHLGENGDKLARILAGKVAAGVDALINESEKGAGNA